VANGRSGQLQGVDGMDFKDALRDISANLKPVKRSAAGFMKVTVGKGRIVSRPSSDVAV
jgi:hypothetical protein